jgi:hypothetical protein
MSSRIIAAILAFAGAAVVVFLIIPSTLMRSSFYDQYVCVNCGIKKLEDIRQFGGMEYLRHVTFEDSAISRAIKVKDCQHKWLLFRSRHGFKRPLLSAYSEGGSPSVILHRVLTDEGFAQELARMEKPSETWTALVIGLNSNQAFDEEVASWWNDSGHVGFAAWAATNEAFTNLKGKAK